MIEVSINGEPRKLAAGTTVAGLLAELALPGDKVAVERNLEIVPRSTFAQVALAQGDRLEIVAESDQLVCFGDGMEGDALRLGFGQRLTIGVASTRLSLVIDPDA